MRTKIVAGNWKMNKMVQQGVSFLQDCQQSLMANPLHSNVQLIICPPLLHLDAMTKVKDGHIKLGAQNCAAYEQGAYTGEVSAQMLQDIGVDYVIIGHSERRQYFMESSDQILEKIHQALAHKLRVILCCGEPLEVREASTQESFVQKQLEQTLGKLTADEMKHIIIAYEPIWAIGTGKTASPEQAQQMHAFIRNFLIHQFSEAVAHQTSILYGGSCKPSNAVLLFSQTDIDGGLIGGASLQLEDFMAIARACEQVLEENQTY